MLSMCDLQDKGKGPYTEISTLLSEYLIIQVQEGIKSNDKIVLHALTVVSGNVVFIFFDNKLYTCGTSGLTKRADLLSK